MGERVRADPNLDDLSDAYVCGDVQQRQRCDG